MAPCVMFFRGLFDYRYVDNATDEIRVIVEKRYCISLLQRCDSFAKPRQQSDISEANDCRI